MDVNLDANSFQLGQGLEWVMQNDVDHDAHDALHDEVVEVHNDPLEVDGVGHNVLLDVNNFQLGQGLVWVLQNDDHDDALHGEVAVVHNEIPEEDGVGHHVSHAHGVQSDELAHGEHDVAQHILQGYDVHDAHDAQYVLDGEFHGDHDVQNVLEHDGFHVLNVRQRSVSHDGHDVQRGHLDGELHGGYDVQYGQEHGGNRGPNVRLHGGARDGHDAQPGLLDDEFPDENDVHHGVVVHNVQLDALVHGVLVGDHNVQLAHGVQLLVQVSHQKLNGDEVVLDDVPLVVHDESQIHNGAQAEDEDFQEELRDDHEEAHDDDDGQVARLLPQHDVLVVEQF